MCFPLTLDDYLRAVARETARLSWPGPMQRILKKCGKDDAEAYFTGDLFLGELKRVWAHTVRDYDSWHRDRVGELAGHIATKVKKHNSTGTSTNYRPEAVAAKLLDTFMHQLMKYEECRFLWTHLYLVLDQQVFQVLRVCARTSPALKPACPILGANPYKISREDYEFVQEQLGKFVDELNNEQGREFRLTSRIQLNVLWATS